MIEASGVVPLPIQLPHTLRVAELPPHHRDPFDRLLIAPAQLEGVPICTADPALRRYEVDCIEA